MQSTVHALQPFREIVKRNGETVPFDSGKIAAAISQAGKATGEFDADAARRLTIQALNLAQQMYEDAVPTVERIQDIVEEVLIASPFRKTARAYIIYREQHAQIRAISSKANVGLVDGYLNKSDWKVSENSNMGFSLQGLNNYVSSEISKVYWLQKIYPERIRAAHSGGDLHIHDLGMLSVYCVGWDLYDLLLQGFTGASGKVESAPAKHFRSALGQVVNFFYTLQGEAAGAQAFSNFDTLLAPFIRHDGLTYTEVKQSLQEFLFNVNVPTRVGFQTPFTNITLDLTVPSYLRRQGVVIGGKTLNETYGDFQPEMDMLNRAFLEVMQEGDASGRVFTFPIPTYNITRDFDWGAPNMDLLWRVTAKYGIPYFANYVNSDMQPEDARSMCCRLRIDNRELRKRGGGLFGSSPLTGSIGVVTVNLPRIGFLAATDEEFRERLARNMEIAKESLEIKRKVLERFTASDLYPYMKFYLRDIHKRYGKYWQNHFSTIGIVGMNEAALNLLGQDITTEAGREFALETLDFMREKLKQLQDETGNIYNLEATPAEGTSYRLAMIDAEKYPGIRTGSTGAAGGNDTPFYTNSSQTPVQYSDDLFTILDHQDDLQCLYTGGTVQHLLLGERAPEPETLKRFIRTVCENYRLPYISITPTFSVCPNCGYKDGEQETCPDCGTPCEIYSRVVGYLRPVNQWNNGKKAEFHLRKTASL